MNQEVHLVIQGSFPKSYILLGVFTDLEEAHEFTRPRLSTLGEIYKGHIPADGMQYIPTIISQPIGEVQKTYPWVTVLTDWQGKIRDLNVYFKLHAMIPSEVFGRRVHSSRSDSRPTFQGNAPSLAQAKLIAEEERREWLTYQKEGLKKVVPPGAGMFSNTAINGTGTPVEILTAPLHAFEPDGGPD